MKTICFVVPRFPSISETFVMNQIIQAKSNGYKVIILTHHLEKIDNSSQQDLLVKYDVLKDIIVIDYKIPKTKLKRLLVGLIPILKYFKYWIQTPNVTIRHRFINLPYLLRFYGKLRHVDVFHVQFAVGGRGIAEMTENGLLQAKVLTTFHGHDAHYIDDDEHENFKELYRVLFSISNIVTVNTSYLVPKVVALGCEKSKIKVVPMCIDVDYFKSKSSKQLNLNDKVKLISIGRLIPLKGFNLAINAIKMLVDDDVNLEYTIVGEGDLFKDLQEQIKTLNLEEKVNMLGNKSQEEIRNLLESQQIYLMSSITDSTGRSEAQGVVTAEAQAMGLPVIAFNSGGVPETIIHDKTGILVSENNVKAYAFAIMDLINHPDRYKEMSEKARDFAVANFSNKIMSDRFRNLYEQ